MDCPKCGEPIPDDVAECPRCVAGGSKRSIVRLPVILGSLCVVLCLLASFLYFARDRARQEDLGDCLDRLNLAIVHYWNDMGCPPATLEDLCAPTDPSPNYIGPYLREIPRHPYTHLTTTWVYNPGSGRVSAPGLKGPTPWERRGHFPPK